MLVNKPEPASFQYKNCTQIDMYISHRFTQKREHMVNLFLDDGQKSIKLLLVNSLKYSTFKKEKKFKYVNTLNI